MTLVQLAYLVALWCTVATVVALAVGRVCRPSDFDRWEESLATAPDAP